MAVAIKIGLVAEPQGIVQFAAAGIRSAAAIRAPSREAFIARCPVRKARPKSAGIKVTISKRIKARVNSTTAWPD